MRLPIPIAIAWLCSTAGYGQSRELRIVFEAGAAQFSDAAAEYQTIWTRDGAAISGAMEKISGLKFEDREVKAIVLEVSSDSGYKEKR